MSSCCRWIIYRLQTKSVRVFVMFLLTISTATVEIICGLRAHSQSLIADGMYSFAEGLCLIGVILVLRHSHPDKDQQKRNTFGYERLELLFGLIQEVFLLSISLGIIVDAVNHLVNPVQVHDANLMIILGVLGTIVGLLGMVLFWGYHHDHDIEEEIKQKKRRDFLAWTSKHTKLKRKSPAVSRQNTVPETAPLANAETKEDVPQSPKLLTPTLQPSSHLDAFTYENVDIKDTRIYATLHALCLHSFVVLLESLIVISSGLLIKFIPHVDPLTGKEINVWLKYIDPLLTLIMVVVIAVRAVPVISSISTILIENVPGGINTQVLMVDIVAALPSVKSIHSLHIWRATAKEIYATFHLVCDEDVSLRTCSEQYGRTIQKILKSYCVRYFTVQFEYVPSASTETSPNHDCLYGIRRRSRGHALEERSRQMSRVSTINIESELII